MHRKRYSKDALHERDGIELGRIGKMKAEEKKFVVKNQERTIEGLEERLKQSPFDHTYSAYTKKVLDELAQMKRQKKKPHEQIMDLRRLAANQLESLLVSRSPALKNLFAMIYRIDISDPYEFHEFATSPAPVMGRDRADSKRKLEPVKETVDDSQPTPKRRNSVTTNSALMYSTSASQSTQDADKWNKMMNYLSQAKIKAGEAKESGDAPALRKWRSLAVIYNTLNKPMDIKSVSNFIQYCRLHNKGSEMESFPGVFSKVFSREFARQYIYPPNINLQDEDFLNRAMNEINRLKGVAPKFPELTNKK